MLDRRIRTHGKTTKTCLLQKKERRSHRRMIRSPRLLMDFLLFQLIQIKRVIELRSEGATL